MHIVSRRAGLAGLAMLTIAGTLLLIAPDAARAQANTGAWGPRGFCTYGGGLGSSAIVCAYDTWDQCMASASGNGQHCIENPYYRPETKAPARARKHRREG
jgi:hypothetical protein